MLTLPKQSAVDALVKELGKLKGWEFAHYAYENAPDAFVLKTAEPVPHAVRFNCPCSSQGDMHHYSYIDLCFQDRPVKVEFRNIATRITFSKLEDAVTFAQKSGIQVSLDRLRRESERLKSQVNDLERVIQAFLTGESF